MPTNVSQSGQPVSDYKPAILSARPSRATFVPKLDTAEPTCVAWATVVPLGFVILSSLPQTTTSNTDFYARASMATNPLTSQFYSPTQVQARYLTSEEQRIFHTALLRSARSIRKASRASV
jgi:hypothetical protein